MLPRICYRSVAAVPLVVVVLLSLQTATTLRAQTPEQLWVFQGIEDIQTMATLPDVDGDQVPDVLIETYDAGADGDHLYLLSGADSGTPTVIWSVRPVSGVSNGGGWGDNCLTTTPDLSGDDFPDVLLGTAWGNRSVHAIDGITGEVLWTMDTYDEPAAGWVYSVAWQPDRNDDGLPEVVFGAGSDNETGYQLDGATGLPIWRFYGATDAIGFTLSLPDVDGDQVADVLFCGWDNDHRVYCVSGASQGVGQQVWSVDTGASNHGATLIDDIDGDAIGEVVVGTWSSSQQVRCLSGVDGTERWTFNNGSYNYIMRLVTINDVNDDGLRDVAIGSFDRAVRVISGADGTMIWQSWAGSHNGGDFWTVDRVDDLSGDGRDEVVGGSFDDHIYLFNGATGDTLWIYNTYNRLYSVRGTGDLSQNGQVDVLGGTQYLSNGGRAYALEGAEGLVPAIELPTVAGRAVLPFSGAGQVHLRWSCDEALPFHVYRQQDTKAAARDKAALVTAFARGDRTTRETIMALKNAQQPNLLRITPEPIQPIAGLAGTDGRWQYRLTDTQGIVGDGSGMRYLLAAQLPGGGEAVLMELQPVVDSTPQAVILTASAAPNPFNPVTSIHFELDREAEVAFTVHDLRGRRVHEQAPVRFPAGPGQIRFTGQGFGGRELAAGLYLITLRAEGDARTLRVTLVR